MRRLSMLWVLWLGACTQGGQSGDEGQNERSPTRTAEESAREQGSPAPPDDPPAGSQPDAVAENADDPGGGAGEQPTGGDQPLPYCRYSVQYGPAEPQLSHGCMFVSNDGEPVPGWQQPGDPTPPGDYSCDCNDGRREISDAQSCEDALEQACAIDVDAPVHCVLAETAGVSGSCYPNPERVGEWRCQCGDGEPLVEIARESCESAVFTTCARACSAANGRCEPLADSVGYECACDDGTSATWPEQWRCDYAAYRCTPACETGAGSCSERRGGFDCFCAGGDAPDAGSSPTSIADDAAFGNCPLALELACGFPPAGERCEEVEDASRVISCVADGQGSWDCECPGLDCSVANAAEPTPPQGGATSAGSGTNESPESPSGQAPPPGLLDQARTCNDAIWTQACVCE